MPEKFYAVCHGRQPGVYKAWSDVLSQTEEFPEPFYKRFDSEEEAEAFVRAHQPERSSMSFDESADKFYAIARGKVIGIYTDYGEVKKNIADYPRPLFKMFTNLSDAKAYFIKYTTGMDEQSDEAKAKSSKSNETEKQERCNETCEKKKDALVFYAVARGYNTGIYSTWKECQKQIKNFKGAKYKKFENEDDAKSFTAGETIKGIAESTEPLKQSFYAVKRGFNPGIYISWEDCEKQVKGFGNACYKRFKCEIDAKNFIDIPYTKCDTTEVFNEFSSSKVLGKRSNPFNEASTEYLQAGRRENNKMKNSWSVETDDVPVVYTDGACLSNGRSGAKAGIGVFWGDDHPDNVSEPLSGEPTNNRAELVAVISALKKAVERKLPSITIRTDSNLIINSMEKWIGKWRSRNWKTSDGNEVKNKDLIVELDLWLGKIQARFEYVPGHSGIYGNEKADKFARKGAALCTL